MKNLRHFLLLTVLTTVCFSAEEPVKPPLKITPGKVIVPTDRMRRIWGELIEVDFATRTGKFRAEDTNEVMRFVVMPYAELLHHAASGDLQDFRRGERAIFRLHENQAGEWVWLTYIQDEMNMLLGHKEFFHVDSIVSEKSQLVCTQANGDQSYVREKGLVIDTDAETRFWKGGHPATFADIKVGDKVRTKTHGVGQGKVRMAWEVFLDEESLLKFQAEQKSIHAARIKAEGAPGYVDEAKGDTVSVTLFNESGDVMKQLKPGVRVRIAPAGVDRKPSGLAVMGTVVSVKMKGRLCEVVVTVGPAVGSFQPAGVARLWIAGN